MTDFYEPGCKVEFQSTDGFREVYELDKNRLSIGAHTDADIAYPELTPEHAELHSDNGNWIIRKRNPNAVLRFKGYPVEIKKLNPGDKVFLGAGVLTFLGDTDHEITAVTMLTGIPGTEEPFRITVVNGPEKGQSIELKSGEYTLGRTENHSIRSTDLRHVEFSHRYVSRVHARVFVEHFQMKVQDMDSTNGTRINGRLVKTGELKSGDVLTLGKLKLRVTGPSNPAYHEIPTVVVPLRDTTWKRLLWISVIPIVAAMTGLAFLFYRLR